MVFLGLIAGLAAGLALALLRRTAKRGPAPRDERASAVCGGARGERDRRAWCRRPRLRARRDGRSSELAVPAGARTRRGGGARRGRLAGRPRLHAQRSHLPHAPRWQLGAAGRAGSAVAGPTAVRGCHRRGAVASASGRRPSALADLRRALAARARRRLCARDPPSSRARCSSANHSSSSSTRSASCRSSSFSSPRWYSRPRVSAACCSARSSPSVPTSGSPCSSRRSRLDALVFPKYILDPNYGIHVARGRGPFVDAVANGLALYTCSVMCAIAVASWRSRG